MASSRGRKIRKRELVVKKAQEKLKSRRAELFFFYFFLILLGCVLVTHCTTYLKSDSETVGTIVGFSSAKRSSACPVVEFYPLDRKKPVTFTGSGSSFVNYYIDEQVQVLYNKAEPKTALIKNNFELYWVPGILIFVFFILARITISIRKSP